jgi:hypothetical protein
MKFGFSNCRLGMMFSIPFFIIEYAAIIISMAKKIIKNILFVIIKPSIINKFLGIIGKIIFRAINTPIIDGIPKNRTNLKLINLFLKLSKAPIKLVEPTINNEYKVAVAGSIAKMYTKIGTARILPPLPNNPS